MEKERLDLLTSSLQNLEQHEPANKPAEEDSLWNTVTETASNIGSWAVNTVGDSVENIGKILTAKSYDEIQSAISEANYAPFKETAREIVNAYGDKPDSFAYPLAQAIQNSKAGYNYFLNDEEKLSRANKIQSETGINAQTVLYDADAWKNANEVYDRVEDTKKFMGFDDLEDVYKAYPVLKNLAAEDPAAGALALKNLPGVSKELSIIETFTKHLQIGNEQLELNNLRFKLGTGKADDNDIQRMHDLETIVEEHNKEYETSFSKDPIGYAVAGVAGSLPEMWQSVRVGLNDAGAWWAASIWAGAGIGSVAGPVGTGAGAAAGGILGGIKAAASTLAASEARAAVIQNVIRRQAINTVMARATAPSLLKTGGQIGAFAGMAAPEVGDRFAEYSELKDKNGNQLLTQDEAWNHAILGGTANAALETVPTFGVLGNIFKKSPQTGKVFESIITRNLGAITLRDTAKKAGQEYLKNIAKVAATESAEEGTQAAADDIILNKIKSDHGGEVFVSENDKLYSKGGVKSSFEILQGAVESSVQAIPSSIIFGMAGGTGSAIGVGTRNAVRYRQLSKISNTYGDNSRQTYVGTIMAEQLQSAVKEDNLKTSAPEVQKKLLHDQIEGTGYETMYIDTEMALTKEGGREDLEAVAKAAGLSEEELQTAIDNNGHIAVPMETFAQSESSTDILDATSFSPEADSIARMKQNSKDLIEKMQENLKNIADNQLKMVGTIANELFPGETEEAIAKRNVAEAAITTNPENPAAGLRELITELETRKREIESEHVTNDVDTETGEIYDISDDVDAAAELTKIDKKLDLLNSIKDEMSTVNGVEMRITEGMSPEAYKVYRAVFQQLKSAPGTASHAARMDAILFARHADIVAKAMAEQSGREYTALDYMNERFGLDTKGKYSGGLHQNTLSNLTPIIVPQNVVRKTETLKPIAAAIKAFEDKNPNGVSVDTPIGKVKINARSIKASLSHGIYQAKLDVIPYLKEGMERAEVLGAFEDFEGKSIKNYFFAFPIIYGDKKHYVVCRIRDAKGGGKTFYIHDVFSEEYATKKSQSIQTQPIPLKEVRQLRGPALYAYILAENLSKVNNDFNSQQEINDRNLVAYHNTNETALRNILRNGRLAAPSIAITRKDIPFNDFGEITLVGNRELINPENGVPVYSRDGYTVRIPQPEHSAPKKSVVNSFVKKWRQAFTAVGDDYLIYELNNGYKNIDARLGDIEGSATFKYYYLTEILGKDVEIPRKTVAVKNEFLRDDETKVAIESALQIEDEDTRNKALLQVVNEYCDKEIAKAKQNTKMPGLAKRTTERLEKLKAMYIGFEKEQSGLVAEIFRDELRALDEEKSRTGEPDYSKLLGELAKYNDIFASSEYADWKRKELKNLAGEEKIRISGKLYPYTVDNIVKYMLKNSGAAQENTLTTGDGKVAAATAEKLSSIDAMHELEGRLTDAESYEESKAAIAEKGDEYRSAIFEYRRKDLRNVDFYDETMNALLDALNKKKGTQKGTLTKAEIKSALSKTEVFEADIPASVLQKGVDFVNALSTGATIYFEAKPQRAVNLNEFSGAVVPSTISADIRAALEDAGLQVETYDKTDATSRQSAVERIQRSQLDVLFQEASTGIDPFDNAYQSAIGQVDTQTLTATTKQFKATAKKTATKQAIEWFTTTYPKGISVGTSVGEVKINRRSIKDSLSHGAPAKKISVVPTLVEGMQRATWVRSMNDYNNDQVQYHYFVYDVLVDGEKNYVLCRVKESDNGARLYVHEVATEKEIKEKSNSLLTRGVPTEGNRTPRGIALYTFILQEYLTSVNTENPKIDRFDQEVNERGIKGSIGSAADGRRIISLFESADESTFAHEMGHLFLLDLEELSAFGGQYAKDWAAVQEWAEYHEKDEYLFKDSPFKNEFYKLAKNIKAAHEAGDVEGEAKLRRQWMHERFARGFEMYLQHGTAPSTALKSVFRKFKQFLTTIYIAFSGDGVRASRSVERIMARMIASDSEVEAAMLDDKYKDISLAGGEKLLGESEKETYARWREEAKEEAKEKVLKLIMKDLEDKKKKAFDAEVEAERIRYTNELEKEPVYLAQKIVAAAKSENAAVQMGLFPSIEAYREAVSQSPTFNEALKTHMDEFISAKDKAMIDEVLTDEKLAELIESTEYHEKLMALETDAMHRRQNAVRKFNAQAEEAMSEFNAAVDSLSDDVDIQTEKDISPGIKRVFAALNKMRFASRWTAKELSYIDDVFKGATKEDMKEAMKKFSDEAGEWKKNLKTIQEAHKGRMEIINKQAAIQLASRPISESCGVGRFRMNEKKAAKFVESLIRAGKWDAAMIQQENRLTSAAMAKAAKKNQDSVQKMLGKVKKQLQARSVKLPAAERYWHRQIAYQLHIIQEAPIKPTDCPDLRELFGGLNESLDVEFDVGEIYDLITQENFTGYTSLTVSQLEDATNLMTVLYKTGRDKFKLKSFDGKLIEDVISEIKADLPVGSASDELTLPKVSTKVIEDDAGGLGYNDILAKIPGFGKTLSRYGQTYLTSHVKPEELLKLLGKAAHKYIYGLYDKAATDEGRRTATAIRQLQEIMSVYTDKEKREWTKAEYTLPTTGEKVTKENILCMALNLGNETNYQRLYRGLGVHNDMQEKALTKFIQENMTEKDWDTVQKIWDHLHSYWQETVKTEEELNGVTLKGVEPRAFQIIVDGKKKDMAGGYYPIVYNPLKSTAAKEQSVDAAAKRTMSGAQVLGTGRGFTNARSETNNIERPLRLQLNVIPQHVQSVIHNISFRIAARDVYRLTHDKTFQDMVTETLGRDALETITTWAVDCWKIMPTDVDPASRMLTRAIGFLRRNATLNIMGYRMWPVIENVTNIFPMMDNLGAAGTISAIGDFLAHRVENNELIEKSYFMSNRVNSMDRDVQSIPGIFDGRLPVLSWLKENAYTLMTMSDLMFSKPLWCQTYKNSLIKNYQDVQMENQRQLTEYQRWQDEVTEIKKKMAPLLKERAALNNTLSRMEYDEEPTTPAVLERIRGTQSRVQELETQLKPLRKELFEAEKHLDSLEDVTEKSPDDILRDAENRSVSDADRAVREVFGSGHTKDLASVQKGGELMKLMTSFYSYFNTQANAILAAYFRGKYAKADLTGLQNIKRWMPLIRTVWYRILLTAALGTVMRMAFLGDGDDDKSKFRKVKDADGKEVEEEIPLSERFFTQLAKNTVSQASGTLIGVREVATLASSMIFNGTDYGRGFNFGSMPQYFLQKAESAITLAAKKADRDEEIAEREVKQKANYDKMSPEAKKRYDERRKYVKPNNRITYADITKSIAQAATSITATKTGITDTMVNAVFGTIQYMTDGDGRYDTNLQNMVWSAFWNKKPVEREIPKKPKEGEKK